MKKLIATNFFYTARWSDGKTKEEFGSYLGRVPASAKTIRAFLLKNARECLTKLELKSVRITGSYISEWISK